MNRFIVVALLIWVLTPSAGSARVGETASEVAKRYGPPVKHNVRSDDYTIQPVSFKGDLHLKNGIHVFVAYEDGKVFFIQFFKYVQYDVWAVGGIRHLSFTRVQRSRVILDSLGGGQNV